MGRLRIGASRDLLDKQHAGAPHKGDEPRYGDSVSDRRSHHARIRRLSTAKHNSAHCRCDDHTHLSSRPGRRATGLHEHQA